MQHHLLSSKQSTEIQVEKIKTLCYLVIKIMEKPLLDISIYSITVLESYYIKNFGIF